MYNATENFLETKKLIGELSVCDLVKVSDYMNTLTGFVNEENEVLDDFYNVLNPIDDMIDKLRVNKHCPHCGCFLYKSDVDQYDYVCVDCDENFYECEVRD